MFSPMLRCGVTILVATVVVLSAQTHFGQIQMRQAGARVQKLNGQAGTEGQQQNGQAGAQGEQQNGHAGVNAAGKNATAAAKNKVQNGKSSQPPIGPGGIGSRAVAKNQGKPAAQVARPSSLFWRKGWFW